MSKSSHKNKLISIKSAIIISFELEHEPMLNDVLRWIFLIKPVESMKVIAQTIIHWDLEKPFLKDQDEPTIDYLETFNPYEK